MIGARDRILYGHSFRNITGTLTMEQCLAKCLEDCKCLSFQICDKDRMCQLCSTNSEKSKESFRLGKGCTSFVFEREQPSQVRSINFNKNKNISKTCPPPFFHEYITVYHNPIFFNVRPKFLVENNTQTDS